MSNSTLIGQIVSIILAWIIIELIFKWSILISLKSLPFQPNKFADKSHNPKRSSAVSFKRNLWKDGIGTWTKLADTLQES